MKYCYYCHGIATHFCYGCGNWICDKYICKLKASSMAMLKQLGVKL